MSLNYAQLHNQVQQFGTQLPQHQEKLEERRQKARRCLEQQSNSALLKRLEAALTQEPDLRCARPLDQPMTAAIPLPSAPHPAYVLAADGSQILPDRHAATLFYLINIGAVGIGFGLENLPLEHIDSHLYYGDTLYHGNYFISDGQVNLQRDLRERVVLADLAEKIQTGLPSATPLLTLTDGPLELWEAREDAGKSRSGFQQTLKKYLSNLERLYHLGVITAGYVDRPRADLVVRLLELAEIQDIAKVRQERPFLGVTDTDLFLHILQPGQRSAVFGLQSQSAAHYAGPLGLHFFYLNLGTHKPYFARVEIPAWVAVSPALLDALHALLIQQCQSMGARGFPYLLHRAHEAALVSMEEKEYLTLMLQQETLRQGMPADETSHKQAAKNLSGRQSYV